ncbi:MAG: sulfotransferase [Planctomycetota bacterium]
MPRPTSPRPDRRPKARDRIIATARGMLADGHATEAEAALAQLGPRRRTDPEALFLEAAVLERRHRHAEAVDRAQRSLEIYRHPEAVALLARNARAAGMTEAALAACDELAHLGHPSAAVLRAGTLEEAGRFDEAEAVLAPMVEDLLSRGEPLPPPVRIEWSKLLVQTKRHDEAIDLIDDTLADAALPDELRRAQLHLKAKAADRAKRYDLAFDAAEAANAIDRIEFDPRLYAEQVDALVENWSAERMAEFPLSSCESEVPVFVAGMPRSGTSLIDQIIDAHPLAAGVGELNAIEQFAMQLSAAWDPDAPPGKRFGRYDARRWTRVAKDYVKQIEALAPPGAERIANKALGNNKLVGLLARLFPRTRIIHAIRDPRDVAISCFMGGFNNRLHAWTTRPEWASHAWSQSRRMMEHWRATLDVPILDVHYERLVADPAREFPRIIEFLGLPWDEACNRFYESRRTVRTLSYDQVNRPLYTSSSGRHANYADRIEDIAFEPYDARG